MTPDDPAANRILTLNRGSGESCPSINSTIIVLDIFATPTYIEYQVNKQEK
jgi:hypothetical protein